MSRSLYRGYLYFVALLMLFYVSTGLYQILDTLLQQTSLRGSGAQPPTRVDAIQSLTAAAIALFIGGGIGGLHYWLIRRDARSDPRAGESAARSFFLNGGEAIAVLVLVGQVVGIVSHYGYESSASFNLATPLEFSLTALAVAAILEQERRRARPVAGAAKVFQRLHEYGAPFVLLLFIVTPTWNQALTDTVSSVAPQDASSQPCGIAGSCAPIHHPLFFWLAAALAVLSLLWFAWLTRRDMRSLMRQCLHLASFAYGLIWLAVGLRSGVEQALRNVMSLSVNRASVLDVVTSAVLGLLVALAYGLWLRREADKLLLGAGETLLLAEAITGLIFAAPFWVGAGLTLYALVERIAPRGATVTRSDLAFALSMLAMGLIYGLVEFDLVRRTRVLAVTGPRRAMTFVLLAGGTLTTAAGGAATLYILVTNLLLPTSSNWQESARTSVVILVVGASLAGLYVWRGRREGAFTHIRPHTAPAVPAFAAEAPAAVPSDEILAVLDDFAGGKLSRDEAAVRLRALVNSGG